MVFPVNRDSPASVLKEGSEPSPHAGVTLVNDSEPAKAGEVTDNGSKTEMKTGSFPEPADKGEMESKSQDGKTKSPATIATSGETMESMMARLEKRMIQTLKEEVEKSAMALNNKKEANPQIEVPLKKSTSVSFATDSNGNMRQFVRTYQLPEGEVLPGERT